MLLNNHDNFFKRSVACSFAKAINGTLNLPGTINNTCNSIGSCKTKIVVTMAGNNCFINIRNIIV